MTSTRCASGSPRPSATSNIDALRARLAELEAEVGEPDLWDNPDDAAQGRPSEYDGAQRRHRAARGLDRALDDAETLFELAREESDESRGGRDRRRRSPRSKRELDELELRVAVHRRVRRARRGVRDPLRRGRHRRAGLGRDAAAHVPALGRAARASTSRSTTSPRARRPASRRPRSSSRAATPTACCAPSTACTGWCASRRSTAQARRQTAFAAVDVVPFFEDDGERGRRSTRRTCASTSTARRAPAASTSTSPTRRCASPTCPPASSCRARTSAASTRTRTGPCRSSRPSWSSAQRQERAGRAGRDVAARRGR